MCKGFLCCVLVLWVCALLPRSFAKDLGAFGATYPIAEENFLVWIKKRIAAMDMRLLQEHLQKSALQYRDRPSPVRSLTRASKSKTWLFDPSVVLTHAITTKKGLELIPKGTRINPLSTHRLSKALLFFNADDQEQRNWALSLDQRLKGRDKLILVGGSVLNTEKLWGKAVYFDQAGRLSTHFGIQHVPAWVTQHKNQLLMTEVAL